MEIYFAIYLIGMAIGLFSYAVSEEYITPWVKLKNHKECFPYSQEVFDFLLLIVRKEEYSPADSDEAMMMFLLYESDYLYLKRLNRNSYPVFAPTGFGKKVVFYHFDHGFKN